LSLEDVEPENQEENKEVQRPTTLKEIGEVLSTTIMQDEKNKTITFLTLLLTYIDEDQINIGFSAESSTGKSYIPIELSCIFLEKTF